MLDKVTGFYEMRLHFVNERMVVLKDIYDSLQKVYFQGVTILDEVYENAKSILITNLDTLKNTTTESEFDSPHLDKAYMLLLSYLRGYKKALINTAQSLSLKNFSGVNNFDKLINGLDNIINLKAMGNIEPTPIIKYAVLEFIEDIRLLVHKTEIEILSSVIFLQNKANSLFIDFINSILENNEDMYYVFLTRYIRKENDLLFGELRLKISADSSFESKLFSFAAKLTQISDDSKAIEEAKQEIASQYQYFIDNIANLTEPATKKWDLFFLSKSGEDFLQELENKNQIMKEHLLNCTSGLLLSVLSKNLSKNLQATGL